MGAFLLRSLLAYNGHLFPVSFPWLGCVPISSSLKDTSPTGWAASFYLNLLFEGLISKYSHILMYKTWRLHIWIWGRYDSACEIMLWNVAESESGSVVSDSLWPHGLHSPWNSPGQNTGVSSLSFLQGIFPTQGSNPGFLHCRRILYQLSHKGSLLILKALQYLTTERYHRVLDEMFFLKGLTQRKLSDQLMGGLWPWFFMLLEYGYLLRDLGEWTRYQRFLLNVWGLVNTKLLLSKQISVFKKSP